MDKIHLMVVDDDKDIGEAMTLAISLTGNESTYFSNPLEAVETFTQDPAHYQGIFTDLQMPELSGDEVIAKIRKTDTKVPIVIITGRSGIFTTKDLVQLNILSVIEKPFELGDVELAVKEIQEFVANIH